MSEHQLRISTQGLWLDGLACVYALISLFILRIKNSRLDVEKGEVRPY